MRSTRRRAALAPLLPSVLLAAACGSDAATRERPRADSAATRPPAAVAPPDAPRPQARVSGTSTSIQVSPSAVGSGGQFVVRFAIRNDGADTVRMTLSCDAAAVFTLREANAPPGSDPLIESTCPPTPRTHVVPPAAELVLQTPTSAQAGRPPRPLVPGLYVIEARPTVTEIDGRPRTLQPVSAELRVR